jgi:hypothetical protein
MSIIRFDPFADLLTNGRWVPAVDIFENGKQELVLKAELPDMKRGRHPGALREQHAHAERRAQVRE